MYKWFELFLAMGAAWAISGILHFALPKNGKSPDSPYAVTVIAVFLLGILDNLLRPELIPMPVLRFVYPFTRLSYFLIGPVLLLYTRILLKDSYKPSLRTLLHLLPFILWFIYVLIDPQSLHPKIVFGENSDGRPSESAPLFSFSFIWDLTVNFSRLIYSTVILVMIRRHTVRLPDRVSSIGSWNTLSWLKYLVIFYTAIYLVNSLFHLVLPYESTLFQVVVAIGRSVPAVLFVFFFSLFSENQAVLAESDESSPEESADMDSSPALSPKYEKSGITESEYAELYARVNKYLEQSRAYLDPDLTLDTLAAQIGETRHRLSETINRASGKRFFNFINDFRLREFSEAVKTDRYPNYTIISVAFECGFRSSSAFYSFVKKELDTTPKALVRDILA